MSDQDHAQVRRFEDEVAAGWRRLGLGRSRIILAVSGGADSVALAVASAAVADRLGLALLIGTVDHGLRAEGAADADAVEALAGELGLECHRGRLALAPGAGLESRAREARYGWLEALRERTGAGWVATAHTASDQAETVLLRLGRGAATRGAAGILPVRDRVVRPLLRLTRAAVREYLRARRVGWREDAMNQDPRFARVRVRQEALPALRGIFGEGVDQRLGRFAGWAQEDEAFLEALADEGYPQAVLSDGALAVARVLAAPAPVARRWVVRYLSERAVEVDGQVVEDVLRALGEGRPATLSGDRLLTPGGGGATIGPSPKRKGSA